MLYFLTKKSFDFNQALISNHLRSRSSAHLDKRQLYNRHHDNSTPDVDKKLNKPRY